MITNHQFELSRNFIYRHGRLIDRKRFAYHFEAGDKQDLLNILGCYQNTDGGFGHGLELDVMCSVSSGICTEMAFGYLSELGVSDGTLFDSALAWVRDTKMPNGDLPHPVDQIKKYPHGPWWEDDGGRIMSIAGLLGRLGKCPVDISERAAAIFEDSHVPFPEGLGVYSYPAALYLRHGDLSGKHQNYIEMLDKATPGMLKDEAWHHPLFFCHDRWAHAEISDSLWRSEAKRAIATIQDDGGILIEQYKQFPWWRPVWTLEMLVTLKSQNLLEDIG
jgi:hypothetical protein